MDKHLGPRRRTVPNRLWQYRKRRGLTQTQVAAILGYVPTTYLSEYERGRKLPNLVTALKLEIIYRIPVAYLYADLYHRLKAELRVREERLRAEWDHEAAATDRA